MIGRRRAGNSKKPSHERWLITYSDMITLLMVFFIVMYAMSNIDAQKFRSIVEALSKALGGGDVILYSPGPSIVEEGIEEIMPGEDMQEVVRLQRIKSQLASLIEEENLSACVSVKSEERGIVVSFQDPVLFALGSAELTPKAKEILHKVGSMLLDIPNYIRVEGHTDDLPIHTARYPSNWELSVARATSVVQELIHSLNFPPERLSAIGYGEYRPRVPNTSAENRQLNRRVNIVILSSEYNVSEPQVSD